MKYILFAFLFFILSNPYAQTTSYQDNLQLASDLLSSKRELPDSVLLKLVPNNYKEFDLLYGTTYPNNKMQKTGFFYTVTDRIFDKFITEKKEQFYLPAIQLASFADGEFGEVFVDKLKIIIEVDKAKFCKAIKGKWFLHHNPIKYFAVQNDCK